MHSNARTVVYFKLEASYTTFKAVRLVLQPFSFDRGNMIFLRPSGQKDRHLPPGTDDGNVIIPFRLLPICSERQQAEVFGHIGIYSGTWGKQLPV